MNPIHSAEQLIERAVELAKSGDRPTIVVAAAQDVDVIGAIAEAEADGFLNGILIGDEEEITKLASEHEIALDRLEIIDKKDVSEAAHAAIKMAADGKAAAIMKGFLPTSALLKVLLDKQYGLRGNTALSHCAVMDIPGYHKLLNLTDGGMIVRPTAEQKVDILENAFLVSQALGLDPVKAALSPVSLRDGEKSESSNQFVVDQIKKKIPSMLLSRDITFERATMCKGEKSSADEVAGDADIFLVDSIEECNIVAKTLIQFAKAVFSGVIVGAKVPVSLVSRTDTMINKKSSLALACVIAHHYQRRQREEGASA